MWSKEAISEALNLPLLDDMGDATCLQINIPNRMKAKDILDYVYSQAWTKHKVHPYTKVIGLASDKNNVQYCGKPGRTWFMFKNILDIELESADYNWKIEEAIDRAKIAMNDEQIAYSLYKRFCVEQKHNIRLFLLKQIDQFTGGAR